MGRHLDSIASLVKRLPPSMRLDTRVGEKVVFTGENGSDKEQRLARSHMNVGQTYTVTDLLVGGSTSTVYLDGVPLSFNSVLFQNPDQYGTT